MKSNPQFGSIMRSKFMFQEGQLCINQCSLGVSPKEIIDAKLRYIMESHVHLELFEHQRFPELLRQSKQKLGDFIHADPEELFFTQTASDAFNSIINNLSLNQDDNVLITNNTYNMVVYTLEHLQKQIGFQIIKIDFRKSEYQRQTILERYSNVFSEFKFKIAIIDNISCASAIKWPLEELVQMCRDNNTISIVDAAHCVGIQQINISQIKPDFFFSNLHKWCFVPKSCVVLYMQKKYHSIIHTNTINMFYNMGVQQEFLFPGIYDPSSQLVVKNAIEFIESLGLNQIIEYSYDIVYQGAVLVAKLWGTSLLTNNRDMMGPIINVRIPCDSIELAKKAQIKLLESQHIYVKLSFFGGIPWARLSGSIYNELSDYQIAAEQYLTVLQDLQSTQQ